VLLLTYGMSLERWRQQGLIDRELSYYRHLQRAGLDEVAVFSYGTSDSLDGSDQTTFRLLPRPSWLPLLAYGLLGSIVHRRAFRRASIVKSNQSRGAWAGVIAKWLDPRQRLVVRCGWVRTREMMTTDERLSGWRLRWAEWVERRTFRSADMIFVTSPSDRDYVTTTYGVPADRVHVMPNAVDTTIFTPAAGKPAAARTRVISVGRLVEMKNFHGLIRAVSLLGPASAVDVVLVGDGPYRGDLERIARDAGTPVSFRSFVPNASIPAELQHADVFVMPQLYGSGMSKVMIEAMACGLIVIASDIRPHREVIEDGVNGFLADVTPEALSACLARVLTLTADARTRIGARARHDAETRYSMAALAEREVAAYRALLH
jgi:glycosyltransferase involved in cell wall biosynthesis